jgi:hypothetical protein
VVILTHPKTVPWYLHIAVTALTALARGKRTQYFYYIYGHLLLSPHWEIGKLIEINKYLQLYDVNELGKAADEN